MAAPQVLTPTATRRPRRWAIVALALVGVALIVMPLAFGMFDRAPKGATMIAGFRPYMTTARLDGYRREIRQIDAGVREANTRVAPALGGPSGRAAPAFAARFPGVADFGRRWGAIDVDMTNLLTTIQANLGNYRAVAALPSFRLFPWFFVVPGVLILVVLFAGLRRAAWWPPARWVLVALGIGLVLAPVAFRMFERAPAGGRMMDAFRTIETRPRVETIQGYFGTIAAGEGAIRLHLVPALRDAGLSDAQIRSRFPAVATLERNWVGILGDLTPMIGAMSDNVDHYAAVAALPPFALFPWFFVLPGLLTAGLAVTAGPRRRRTDLSAAVTSPSRSVSEGGP